VCPNIYGRKGKSGKASSNKLNKAKQVAALNKYGLSALDAIMRIAKKAEKEDNAKLAITGYTFVASEWSKALANQERMQFELKKLNKALQDEQKDNDDSSEELNEVILSFNSFTGTDNE
jgi:dienelactone hydrolase